MKKFFYVGVVLVALALSATIIVWYLLQQTLATPNSMTPAVSPAPTTHNNESEQSAEVHEVAPATATTNTPPESTALPVPELSDGQRQAAEAVGIDVDEITLTPAMIACAEEKMSRERMLQIAEGGTPSFFEALALVPCVKAE